MSLHSYKMSLHSYKMLGRGVYGNVRIVRKLGFERAIKETTFGEFPQDLDKIMACLREEDFNLNHPFIIQRYWTRWKPGVFQVCMQVGIPVEQAPAERILHDISQALCFMHEQGFIHRDVKPENIVFANGYYKLIDFGLTRRGGAKTMLTGYTITRIFRPPEMLRAGMEDILYDGRVDMYSLGLTAYNLDHGEALFLGSSEEILEQYNNYVPKGIYKHLICDYTDRYTARKLLEEYGVTPIRGTITKLQEREGNVQKFVQNMLNGFDEDAKEVGYKTIYDDF